MKKILILGAGLVAQPIIRHLLDTNYLVTVASNTPERALAMVDSHPNGEIVDWNIEDKVTLSTLISENDLTVSLLPYIYHVDVAEICVKHKKTYGDHLICET